MKVMRLPGAISLSATHTHTHTHTSENAKNLVRAIIKKKFIWTEFKSNLYNQEGQKSGIDLMGKSYFCYPLLSVVVTGH